MFDQAASAREFSPMVFSSNIVFLVLTTASVAVRLIAKATTKAKYGLDDVFIVAAQCCWAALAGLQIKATQFGKNLMSPMQPEFPKMVKYTYISGCLYAPTVLFISLSILFFYQRIFPIQSFKRLATGFVVAHVLWALGVFFAQVFMCVPVQLAFADAMTMMINLDKCIDYPLFFVISMSLELGLNAAVLCLPIQQSLQLQLSMRTRLMLSIVFMLGGVSLVSGIVRIQQSYIPNEPFVDLAGDMFWLSLHVSTALIAASLPIYRPLMRASVSWMSESFRKIYGSYGSLSEGKGSGSPSSQSQGFSFSAGQNSQRSLVGSEKTSDQYENGTELVIQTPKRGHISVQRTFDVV